jgi:hypothetical protein
MCGRAISRTRKSPSTVPPPDDSRRIFCALGRKSLALRNQMSIRKASPERSTCEKLKRRRSTLCLIWIERETCSAFELFPCGPRERQRRRENEEPGSGDRGTPQGTRSDPQRVAALGGKGVAMNVEMGGGRMSSL